MNQFSYIDLRSVSCSCAHFCNHVYSSFFYAYPYDTKHKSYSHILLLADVMSRLSGVCARKVIHKLLVEIKNHTIGQAIALLDTAQVYPFPSMPPFFFYEPIHFGCIRRIFTGDSADGALESCGRIRRLVAYTGHLIAFGAKAPSHWSSSLSSSCRYCMRCVPGEVSRGDRGQC